MSSARLPNRDGDAPLSELSRDHLSVLLYMAFTGKELATLIRDLKVHVPGFRLEKLSDAERADVMADEIREAEDAEKAALDLFRKIYEFPALDVVALSKEVAEEIARLAVEHDAPVRMLWRLIADPEKSVRDAAKPALDRLVKEFYGPLPEGEQKAPPSKKRGDAPAASDAENARLKKAAERAESEVAGLKSRLDEIKEELRAARAAVSEAQREAGAAKRAREDAEKKLAKAETKAPKIPKGAGALREARKEAEDARHRAEVAERRAGEIAAELEALKEAQATKDREEKAAHARPAAGGGEDEGEAIEAPPSTWLFPRFTREFYDSLDGWEPRIVRAAFKQAMLLAENHRHPSLRAIPLEGVPGFYRVRVATDVRLIYKRIDRDVEILSLIDREDLDRYVREAKTR